MFERRENLHFANLFFGNQIKRKIRNDNNMNGYWCMLEWMDEPEDFNTGETTL